jgi:hypothetical protein
VKKCHFFVMRVMSPPLPFVRVRASHPLWDMLNAIIWGVLALLGTGCGGSSMATSARVLLSISVQPSNGDATAPTGTLPFTATGTFNQPPTTQTDLGVQWSSSDGSVATMDANTGVATCVAAGGPVTIAASADGKQGTAQLTCLSSPVLSSGNCVYVCGSTRCPELTGYCSGSEGNACRQAYDPVHCPVGQPAGSTTTDACAVGIDTTRSCTP